MTSRAALDRLKASQRRREDYVGPWLPEPIQVGGGPEATVELAESLTLGFLAVLERLEGLLHPDIVLVSDGGAHHHAARNPVVTAPRVARFLINLNRRAPEGGLVRAMTVNGEAALVLGPVEQPTSALVFETRRGAVVAIRIMVDPDKLGHLAGPVALR